MSLLCRAFVVVVSFAVVPGVVAADSDSKASPATQDRKINRGVENAIRLGAFRYNAGDAAGCSGVYQGALYALFPWLDGRPELKNAVESGLKQAQAQPTAQQQATVLRRLLDQVAEATKGATPLWDRLGGEAAVKAVVHDFVALAATDPKVDFTRGGRFPIDSAGVAHLEDLLVQLISATTGGPLKYEGRDMKSAHKGMAITTAQFGALAADLIEVLKKYKVPQKEIDELIAIIATTKKDIVEVE